jgi:hypothetical protein
MGIFDAARKIGQANQRILCPVKGTPAVIRAERPGNKTLFARSP